MGRNTLTAQEIVRHINRRYYELSHDKVEGEYRYFKKLCLDWCNTHDKVSNDPEDWETFDDNF